MTSVPDLEADCSRCFGLCCVALPFARSADFPLSKSAGQPCHHLSTDFACGIHDRLRARSWKGCAVFDCFGAGQQVSQVTFGGVSWREAPDTAQAMYAVLPVMHQLHEMLTHLTEVEQRSPSPALGAALRDAREAVAGLTSADAPTLLEVDLGAVRARVGPLLRSVSDDVRLRVRREQSIHLPSKRFRAGVDLIGADLRGVDLRTADLRGALLIAADLRGADLRWADLLGADLRDARIGGARLDHALFLTRPQVSAARVDDTTVTEP